MSYELQSNYPYRQTQLDHLLEFSVKYPDFFVDPNGSTIFALLISIKRNINDNRRSYMDCSVELELEYYMLYQRQSNGLCVELIDRIDFNNASIENFDIISLPLPNGKEINGIFECSFSSHFDKDDTIIDEIFDTFRDRDLDKDFYDEILNMLNGKWEYSKTVK